MSCFIMNPEPLAALANAIETRLNVGFDYWGFEAPDSLYRELADCKTSCTYFAEPIYRKLYALNVRAYNGRYSNHEGPADEQAPDVDISRYTITRRPEYRAHTFAVQPWHYQLAKLLDCYLCQTLEDATYSDPLRLALAEFRDGLFGFIITRNPQYIALPWGALAAPYTPDKTGYHRSDEVEPLILEPDDWQPGEWATLCKLAGHLPPQETERIVISGYTLETFTSKKESAPAERSSRNNALWDALANHIGHNVSIALYGSLESPADICLECEDCDSVVLDAEIYTICPREDLHDGI